VDCTCLCTDSEEQSRSFAERKESGLQWALAGCERRGRGWNGGPAAGAAASFSESDRTLPESAAAGLSWSGVCGRCSRQIVRS
jgi:hypothetical protein